MNLIKNKSLVKYILIGASGGLATLVTNQNMLEILILQELSFNQKAVGIIKISGHLGIIAGSIGTVYNLLIKNNKDYSIIQEDKYIKNQSKIYGIKLDSNDKYNLKK